MPKLKHLAIRTEDTGKLATFYMDVFEMQVLHKDKNEGGAIFLTDGYFNLAILPNHEQQAPNGLYHFGFEVENIEELKPLCKDLGAATEIQKRPPNREAEYRVHDPDGTPIDLSQHGWPV